jgi:signal transduction histidine kinase
VPTDPAAPGADRVGARRFERLLEIIVGVFGVPFALQTSDSFLAGRPSMAGPVGDAVVALTALAVVVGLVAGVTRARSRQLFLVAFLLYVVALLMWPFAITGPVPADPMPWFAALAPVSCAYLVVAVRHWFVQLLCTALVAVDIGVVLVLLGGLGATDALLDSAFVAATSGLLIVLIGGVRRAVMEADAAQQAVLDRYAENRLDHAIEEERIRTDALVHDRVLTTFLSAAAVRTPEDEALASRMAGTALRVLSRLSDQGAAELRVPITRTLAEAASRLAPVLQHVDLQLGGLDHVLLPAHVADAMVDAMAETMENSVRHAGAGSTRSARIEPFGIEGVRIVVEDDGTGFDVRSMLGEGTGLRVSVIDRVEQVEGRVLIESAPGAGTRIELLWGADVELLERSAPSDAVTA